MSDEQATPPEPRGDPWRPLGDPVRRPERPAQPEWTTVPGKPHLEQDRRGRLRTNLPLPKG